MKDCIILGSGRSGTSMLSGILHNAGYFMGDNLYQPNDSNPKGFFENAFINGINERILKPYNHESLFNENRPQRWLMSIDPKVSITTQDSQILADIRDAVQHSPFCYKDPRFCYTLPIWKDYLPENVIILCIFRSPEDTLLSIIKECYTAPYLADFYADENYLYKLWENLYTRVLDYADAKNNNIVFVHYDQILHGQALQSISEKIGKELKTEFIDPTLKRTKAVNEVVPTSTLEIYQRLCREASFKDELEHISTDAQSNPEKQLKMFELRISNKEKALESKSRTIRKLDYEMQERAKRIQTLQESNKAKDEIIKPLSAQASTLFNAAKIADYKNAALGETVLNLQLELDSVTKSKAYKLSVLLVAPLKLFLDFTFIRKFNPKKDFYVRRILKVSFEKISNILSKKNPPISPTTDQLTVVIARYNEKLRWSRPLKKYREVYNKGADKIPGTNSLPNVGRESHTYLNYIVKNYDNLSEITLFCQGRIKEDTFLVDWLQRQPRWRGQTVQEAVLSHRLLTNPILIETPFVNRGLRFGLDDNNRLALRWKWGQEYKEGKIKDSDYDFVTWLNKFVFKDYQFHVNQLVWAPHALLYIHRDLILSNSKDYYQTLLKEVSHHVNPIQGHYFERSWIHIFTRSYFNKISVCLNCMDIANPEFIPDLIERLNKYPNLEIILGISESQHSNLADLRLPAGLKLAVLPDKLSASKNRIRNILARKAASKIITWFDHTDVYAGLLFRANVDFTLNRNSVLLFAKYMGAFHIFVAKEDFELVRGFDENFLGDAYCESDLAERITKANCFAQIAELTGGVKDIQVDSQGKVPGQYTSAELADYLNKAPVDAAYMKKQFWFFNDSPFAAYRLNRAVSRKLIDQNEIKRNTEKWGTI